MKPENTHEFSDLEVKQRKTVIDGVGADAEIVTNDLGGKQSKTPAALHLIDPKFFEAILGDFPESYPLNRICQFMQTNEKRFILQAIEDMNDDAEELNPLLVIGKVLQYGADRYEPNNWRLIPQESHINHALIHYVAYLMGDTQDDHIDHCMCRLMMAYATEVSEGFSYTEYVKKSS